MRCASLLRLWVGSLMLRQTTLVHQLLHISKHVLSLINHTYFILRQHGTGAYSFSLARTKLLSLADNVTFQGAMHLASFLCSSKGTLSYTWSSWSCRQQKLLSTPTSQEGHSSRARSSSEAPLDPHVSTCCLCSKGGSRKCLRDISGSRIRVWEVVS